MKVTQPWQDELADLAQKVETKMAEFKEIQATVGKLFVEQVTKESLEQAKGSIIEMVGAHEKLQDVYTHWSDRTNKIIEEHREQKRHAVASGSGMSHK